MNLNSLWVEKYRPNTLNDLCVCSDTRNILNGFGDEIPNLLLTSTPGTGKTSLARILVLDVMKCDYLYINASDENGIDTIRNKVSGFAQTKSFDGKLKIIILDECDFLSNSGMAALRNTMEEYSKTTRFILTGNYRHKILPALQSRCQSLDIRASIRDVFKRCLYILKQENISASTEQKRLLASLVKSKFPDLRICINEMQKYCRDGVLNLNVKNNTNDLCELIYNNILSKKSLQTRKHLIENDEIFNSDWEQLLTDLLNYIYDLEFDESRKKAMILTIADHLEKCIRVSDREINLFACLLNLENI